MAIFVHIAEKLIPLITIYISIQLVTPKKNSFGIYIGMYGGSTALYALYLLLVQQDPIFPMWLYLLLVLIPSACLFSFLSIYSDFRTIVSFNLAHTLSLILLFIPYPLRLLFSSPLVGDCVLCATLVLLLVRLVFGRPLFRRYRALIAGVTIGWSVTFLATTMIYFMLLFTAAYPLPLSERSEYYPVFFCLCMSALALYGAFARFLYLQKQVCDLNLQLESEKNWHDIAYKDGLTGMANRMAYIERISEIERAAAPDDEVYAVMIDLNGFKKINDTHGHHFGDLILQKAALRISECFEAYACEVFRIGGDEFAVIATRLSEEALNTLLAELLDERVHDEVGCSLSIGYAKVDFTENNAMETAFIRADSAMYRAKSALPRR